MEALISTVMRTPVGTNLGLLRVLWAMVSGQMLSSRGAMLPALQGSGLSDKEVRQAWSASRYGAWDIRELIEGHVSWVKTHTHWKAIEVGALPEGKGGYRVRVGDMVGFFRPKLEGCPTKHFHPLAGQALPAIGLGMIAEIGHIGEQRIALLKEIVRMPEGRSEHKALRKALIKSLRSQQNPEEDKTDEADMTVDVGDAELSPGEMLEAGSGFFVVRGDKNATFCRAELPAYAGRGRRPKKRKVVRPLPRKHKDHEIAADLPDKDESWLLEDGRKVQANIWSEVYLPDSVLKSQPDLDPVTQKRILSTPLTVVVIHDPKFEHPLLLITNINQTPASTIYAIYPERWPIETIPLSAKHMIGAHRQFVHAPEHTKRLPELALLAGNILSCVAATAQPTATGFWDRLPKATPGRLRKVLSKVPFPSFVPLPLQLRKKNSVFHHLPFGNQAKHPANQPNLILSG